MQCGATQLIALKSPGGGTLPTNICITNLKPDIVIVDEEAKEVHIYELTCPSGPANIEKRHLEKTQKYSTFLTDCTGYNSFVVCFEVSSKGFLTPGTTATSTPCTDS